MFQEGGKCLYQMLLRSWVKLRLNIDYVTIGFINMEIIIILELSNFNGMVVIKALRDQTKATNINKPFDKLCQNANKEIGQ